MEDKTRKRILHIKHGLSNDGATLVEYNFAKKLSDKYIFDWLVFTDENINAYLFEELGSKVYVLKHCKRRSKLINKITELSEYRRFFRQHHYDTVHIDTDTLRMDGMLYCARKEGIRNRIIHSHNSRGESAIRGLDRYAIVQNIRRRLIAKWATHYLACSNLAAEWMFPQKLRRDCRVTIIRNGIDGKRYLFNEQTRKRIRDELGLSDENKLIGHIGRFSKQKNHPFLIDFFELAHKADPNLKLMLIGSGDIKKEIIEKIEAKQLSDKVILIDSTSRVEDYLSAMDIFVLPSLFEGLPLTCLESQASGLPTIMSDTITKEANITPLSEYLPINDPALWANRINNISLLSSADRIVANDTFSKSGFEINDAAKELDAIYNE